MPDAKWLPLDTSYAPDTWSGCDWMKRAQAGERVDPRMVWADATRFVDLGQAPPAVPVAIELKKGRTAAQFAKAMVGHPGVLVPYVFGERRVKGLDSATFCTALVKQKTFVEIDGKYASLRDWIERFELDLPVEWRADAAQRSADVSKGNGGDRTGLPLSHMLESDAPHGVVGVIDHGIAFAHRRFLVPGTDKPRTRIQYFWNQEIASLPKGTAVVPDAVPRLGYGRELVGAEIDAALTKNTYAGLIDEDAVYRELQHDGVARRLAHGTHVMDIACGADDATDPVSQVPIVAVQLPWATAQDTSGGSLTVHAINGMRYVLDRADALAKRPIPVVVNMSYGTLSGRHDGSSILEAALDEIVRLRSSVAPCAIVVPSGNAHLARCHVKLDIAAGKREPLPAWRILPDDGSPSFLEIWFPKGTSKFKIEVSPPRGASSDLIPLGEGRVWRSPRTGDVLCTVVALERNARGDAPMAFIAVAPTSTVDGDRELAPSGNWTVTVTNESRETMAIEAWIQRDDRLPGARLCGRQSRFEDASYELFKHPSGRFEQEDNQSPVKRAGSMSGMANGHKPVVVGGYRRSDQRTVSYSAGGPTLGRTGPDALAVTEESVACTGVLAAGSRSGSVVAMRGTSVAAPQATRALILEYLRAKSSAATSVAAAAGVKPGAIPVTEGRLVIRRLVRPPSAAMGTPSGKSAIAPDPAVSSYRGGSGQLPPPVSSLRRREP